MRICVYCSSSSAVEQVYFDVAQDLGRLIGQRGHSLVYGGCDVGVMGAVARAVKRSGGHVMGVLPRWLDERGLTYRDADEILVTESMAERKALMEDHSDAFIALPGGLGTLEELSQVLTRKQLASLRCPVVIVNVRDFYGYLLAHLERLYAERFAKPEYRQLYHVAVDAQDALAYIEHYKAGNLPSKWF